MPTRSEISHSCKARGIREMAYDYNVCNEKKPFTSISRAKAIKLDGSSLKNYSICLLSANFKGHLFSQVYFSRNMACISSSSLFFDRIDFNCSSHTEQSLILDSTEHHQHQSIHKVFIKKLYNCGYVENK